MILQRSGRIQRALIRVAIVAAALSQVVTGPAFAQQGPVSIATTTGAVVAQQFGQAARPPQAAGEGLAETSDAERQAYGCLVGGGAAAVLTAVAGATETVKIVAGGMLVPTNSLVLWVSLAGTVIASSCAMGALATPGVVRLWNYYYNGARPAGK